MYDILWDFRVKLKATTHSNTKKVLFCRLIPPTSSLTPQERVRIWVVASGGSPHSNHRRKTSIPIHHHPSIALPFVFETNFMMSSTLHRFT